MTKQVSFPRDRIKVLFLEGIHPVAVEKCKAAGYTAVEPVKYALSEAELLKRIPSIHILGIRSKTHLSQKIIKAAPHLLAVGCFCIGTNQVALDAAARAGVVVFNAPFSNTRSVAELTMAEVVMLARKAAHKSMRLHQGEWDKSAAGCFEVRNKTIGIVGYGHIGPQVGLLAEAFGMKVLFYDIAPKLALGNAEQLPSLDALLERADFVTLHVPETPQTKNMISTKELARMRRGGYLLNLSRGSVVDLHALTKALKRQHLAGAALDVYPQEPESNAQRFEAEVCGLDNVILTPHVGGSTEEAQRNIAIEVVQKLCRYSDTGSTTGAVNFPEVELPILKDCHRILNIHRNVPGVLRDITKIIAEKGGNIRSQYLGTSAEIGYLIMDVEQRVSQAVKQSIEKLETNIKTRVLF